MNALALHRTCLLALFMLCFSCKQQGEEKANIPSQGVRPFALSQVQLLDGPFKHATSLNEQILLAYEPYRLLSRFRSEAGLEFNKQEWAEVQEKFRLEKEAYSELEKETYDFFQPGEMQPERNHNFQGEKVYVVEMKDRKARQAERGGWFSFEMKVVEETPMALVFEYWGGYTGKKIFDIQVDGVPVATQDISGIKDGSFLTLRYPVPEDLTRGKEKITVKIMPHHGSRGGPVFGVRTVRR